MARPAAAWAALLLLLLPTGAQARMGQGSGGGPNDPLPLVESLLHRRLERWWETEGKELRDVGGRLPLPALQGRCRVDRTPGGPGWFSYLVSLRLSCSLTAMGREFRVGAQGVGPSSQAAIRDAALRISQRLAGDLEEEIWRTAARGAMERLTGELAALSRWNGELNRGKETLMRLPPPTPPLCTGAGE